MLVVTGPYRYMRHPMYFGAALAIAGAALFYQSPCSRVRQRLPALLPLLRRALRGTRLQRTFGEEYDSYRQQVGRWGPSGFDQKAVKRSSEGRWPKAIGKAQGTRPKAKGPRPRT